MPARLAAAAASAIRQLAGGDDSHGDDDHSSFGVHIEYSDLYNTFVFLSAIYVGGRVASFIKMPSLVGEIVCGILLGPPLLDFVPNAEAWVLLGELGLVLLVIEAGIDIDVATLKLIGTRGMMVAFVGSVLPIAFGFIIAVVLFGTSDMKANIAIGSAFGPTSLGIALNILRSGNVLNTPVGQMIVSAAVIDDMIALIVLSQLESLVGEITVAGVLIPIVSALCFLVIGGYIALFIAPGIINSLVLSRFPHEKHGRVEIAIMFAIVLALMPATHYAKASYLMGAFVAGLSFCTSHELHISFVRQFKRLLQWLMRIFFAASIGFQVPIKDLFQGPIIAKGLLFTLALLGKLAVGFMVPNFTQSKSFTNYHLRDCLITGFSMAAEGEFAFVIAVFAVENGLIDKDQYAAVVLAVLLSTIVPPFLLRFTISYYNKRSEKELQELANDEMERNHQLEAELEGLSPEEREDKLVGDIVNRRAVFLCLQTQSESAWGLMPRIMTTLAKLELEIIDHRSWHPRGINTTLVNEIYVKDQLTLTGEGKAQEQLEKRIAEVQKALEDTINQPETSKVKVQRWFPGVVEEIVEHVHDRTKQKKSLSIEQRLLSEAATELERRQSTQTGATKERTVEEILYGMHQDIAVPSAGNVPTSAPRRRRQKMRSTPVVGGGLFGETHQEEKEDIPSGGIPTTIGGVGGAARKPSWKPDLGLGGRGHRAEIIIDGESYDVRINAETLKSLRTGFSGDMVDSRGVSVGGGPLDTSNVTTRLQGFVRNNAPMSRIAEESDGESETSSHVPTKRTKEGPLPPV